MPARKKSHPLETLTFTAPKLDEVTPPPTAEPMPPDGETPAPAPEAEPAQPEEIQEPPIEVETRASSVILPVTIWNWIDAKHAEARRNGGKATRKAAIIRAVFEVVMELDFDLSGSQSEEEIVRRIKDAMMP